MSSSYSRLYAVFITKMVLLFRRMSHFFEIFFYFHDVIGPRSTTSSRENSGVGPEFDPYDPYDPIPIDPDPLGDRSLRDRDPIPVSEDRLKMMSRSRSDPKDRDPDRDRAEH